MRLGSLQAPESARALLQRVVFFNQMILVVKALHTFFFNADSTDRDNPSALDSAAQKRQCNDRLRQLRCGLQCSDAIGKFLHG